MRNLKRALSLALASVMLLGMMVIGSSAASFPDVDANDNVEAIEVLNAVGVMVGDKGTGTFRPDSPVTRNEMAVVMAKLLLGTYEADSYVGTHPFNDVPEWASRYVAACYASGIVAGRSATIYDGASDVTAVEAAAMMLRALGYEDLSKNAERWDQPVAAKANELGLFAGLSGNGNAVMNRNSVAKLALNTLETTMVTTTRTSSDINIGNVSINGNLRYDERNTNVYDYTKANGKYNYGDDDELQLCEFLYGSDLRLRPTTADAYGQPGKAWTYKNSDVIAYRSDSAVLTYTDYVETADVTKDLKNYKDPDSAFAIQIDGHNGTSVANKSAIATAINGNAGKGVTVNVFADDDNKITDVVVINSYIGQVTRVKTEGDETTTTVSKKAGGSRNDNTFETDAFEKDDYVLYTVGSDGIETMTAASKTTGKITALSGTFTGNAEGYMRLDGTQYDYNRNRGKDSTYTTVAVKDEIDAYLDGEGNVLYIAKVEGAADQYLFVKGADLYFDTISIRAVFADGTTKIVNLSGDTQFTSNAVVASGGTKLSDMTPVAADATGLVGDVYKYTEGGDTVKLTSAGIDNGTTLVANAQSSSLGKGAIGYAVSQTASPSANDLKFAIEKNNSTLYTSQKYGGSSWADDTTNTGADVVTNNDTVYVLTSDGTTYTGFRNVPSMEAVKLFYITNADNASLVDLVFITAKTDGADENASYFYIKDNTKYEEQDGFTVWNEAYVNGEKTSVITKGKYDESGAGAVINAAGIYKAVKTNNDGYVTDVTKVIEKTGITSSTPRQAIVASSNTLMLDGANKDPLSTSYMNVTNWSYDSETVFVSIDVDGDVTADTSVPNDIEKKTGLVADDSVYYIFVAERKGADGKDATTAKTVYVVETTVPWNDISSVTITTVTSKPAKDAAIAAPTSGTTQVTIASYQWYSVADDGTATAVAAGGTFAASTAYRLVITVDIATANAATHRFASSVSSTIDTINATWNATAKTLTFNFPKTGA